MHKKRNRKSPDYRGIALKLYNERYNPNHPQTKALGDVLESGVKFIDDKAFGDTKVGNIVEELVGTAGNVVQGIYAPTPDAWAGVAADFSGLVADTSAAFTGNKFEVDRVTGEPILDDQGNPIPKMSGVEKVARNVEAGGESAQGFLSGNWQKGVSSGAEFIDQTVENVTDFEGKKEDTKFQKGIKTGKQIINTGLQAYNQFENMQDEIGKFKEDLNAGENIETARRGGNVQDRINRMRSYLGGHKVRPQQFANGDDVSRAPVPEHFLKDMGGDPPIITDEMLQQMVIEWEKGTQTSIHPSELPRTQMQFDQLDPKLKKIIVGQYPDIRYLIHKGQPTREEMMNLYGPGGSHVPVGRENQPNIIQQGPVNTPTYQAPSPGPGSFQMNNPQLQQQDLINAQRGNTGIVLPPMGAAPMKRGTKVRSYENGDVTKGDIKRDPLNSLYTDPSLNINIGKLPGSTPEGSYIGSNFNPRFNMGYVSNYGDDASDLTKLGNMTFGGNLSLQDKTNIGATMGYTQPLGTTGNLRNTIASIRGGAGLQTQPGSPAEAYGDLNLGLGYYNNLRSGTPYGIKGNFNLGSQYSVNPGISGGLEGNLGMFRGFGGYGSQGGYGGLGVSIPIGRSQTNETRRMAGIPGYEKGAEVQADPSLQGISGDDLTTINRQSGEVVRRNYPGTTDHDVKNYYQYTGTSHSNVRPGMPNGGNDVKEQVGAFIFPKKHAKSISKIVRDRKYFQDIINKSKSV
jgi:hypothetical protein